MCGTSLTLSKGGNIQVDDATQQVLAGIQVRIQSHLDEIAKLKRTANSIADLIGEGPVYTDVESESAGSISPARADAYYGKPLATAVREYLEFRRQAVPVDDVLRGLEKGGFDFDALQWNETGRNRALAMSMAKNTSVFHKLPNGMWGLMSWYPEAQKKKGKSKAKTADKPTPEENGSAAETTEPSETNPSE